METWPGVGLAILYLVQVFLGGGVPGLQFYQVPFQRLLLSLLNSHKHFCCLHASNNNKKVFKLRPYSIAFYFSSVQKKTIKREENGNDSEWKHFYLVGKLSSTLPEKKKPKTRNMKK